MFVVGGWRGRVAIVTAAAISPLLELNIGAGPMAHLLLLRMPQVGGGDQPLTDKDDQDHDQDQDDSNDYNHPPVRLYNESNRKNVKT